jgi:Domain of unknown function (DUF6285)
VVPPGAGADNRGVQDRPEAHELAAAVAEFLSAQVRPAVPDELRFLVLVAANACAILARETEAMTAAPADEIRRLSTLLGDGGAGVDTEEGDGSPERLAWELRSRLAARIRAGELDERWDEAISALRDSVRAKLAVAHPGYDDFADDGRGTSTT